MPVLVYSPIPTDALVDIEAVHIGVGNVTSGNTYAVLGGS